MCRHRLLLFIEEASANLANENRHPQSRDELYPFPDFAPFEKDSPLLSQCHSACGTSAVSKARTKGAKG